MSNIIPAEFWAIIVFAGHMLDMYTTRYGITNLGVREANPLGRVILGRWGFKGLQVFKSVLAGALLIAVGLALNNIWLWIFLAGLSWFPPIWNASIILRYK